MDLNRQEGIINQEIMDNLNIVICGVGALGGWTAYALAKMGIKNISVYDFDKVENQNIPAQIYGSEHIGMEKTEAIKQIIHSVTGTLIAVNGMIDVNTDFQLMRDKKNIVLSLVDSIETRKLIYEHCINADCQIIDARMGGEGWQMMIVNMLNELECLEYQKTFEGNFTELPCGFHAVIYSVWNVSSEIVNQIKRISKEQNTSKTIRREMTSNVILSK